MKDKKNRYISVITLDVYGWEGYWVRVRDIKGDKPYQSKTFNINRFGGDSEKALAAARRFRNKVMKELNFPSSGALVGPGLTDYIGRARKNKYGIHQDLPIGVSLREKSLKNGHTLNYFVAYISPRPYTSKTLAFRFDPLDPLSKKKALKGATKQRREWEKIYYK